MKTLFYWKQLKFLQYVHPHVFSEATAIRLRPIAFKLCCTVEYSTILEEVYFPPLPAAELSFYCVTLLRGSSGVHFIYSAGGV